MRIITVFTVFIVLFLNSCLTIEYDLKLNSNGSGSLSISYFLDKQLQGISSIGNDDDIVPLNLSEDYLSEVIGARSDIFYQNYRVSEDEFSYNIFVTFVFDSVEALNAVLPEENRIELTRVNGETTFRQTVMKDKSGEIDNETLSILNDIFKEHYFKFILRTPGTVKKTFQSELIEDRVTEYNEKFMDILIDDNKKEWSVIW